MNERKLNQLFRLSREETSPAPPESFDGRVLAAIRRETRLQSAEVTLWDQLGLLFPRLAVAVVLLIGLCALADLRNSSVFGSVSDGVNQVSAQWLFASEN